MSIIDVKRKTHKADIDRLRPRIFACAFIGITLLFVLIANFRLPDMSFVLDIIEDDNLEVDLDMLPSLKAEDDMIEAPIAEEPKVTSKIQKVDDLTEELKEQLEQRTELVTEGDGIKDDELIEQPVVDMDDKEVPLKVVEELPEYPGGMSELVKWMTRTLRYPQSAKNEDVQGRVLISFIVNKDGSYTDLKVEQSADPRLDAEALRVLKMMKRWKPGHNHGHPCRTKVAVPVVFAL